MLTLAQVGGHEIKVTSCDSCAMNSRSNISSIHYKNASMSKFIRGRGYFQRIYSVRFRNALFASMTSFAHEGRVPLSLLSFTTLTGMFVPPTRVKFLGLHMPFLSMYARCGQYFWAVEQCYAKVIADASKKCHYLYRSLCMKSTTSCVEFDCVSVYQRK